MPRTDTRTDVPTPAASTRLTALDGLRGFAAFVVVFHHSMLMTRSYPGIPGTQVVHPNSPIWWISYTPLKLLTAGWESVIVFFVLSGVVVTLPVVRRAGFDWIAYFPRRVVRLLVPVIVAAALAAVVVMAVPQHPTASTSGWLRTSSTPNFTWQYIVRAWDLFDGDWHIDNPLWSLRWELLFSLALPVFVVVAISLRRWWMAGLAAAVALSWLGQVVVSGALSFLPAFFVGAVVAVRLEAVRVWAARVNGSALRHVVWPLLTLGGATLLIAPWLLTPIAGTLGDATIVIRSFAPIAAAALVVGAIGWRGFASLLQSRPLAFAGRVSFSLYLVHVPILVASSYLFAQAGWFVTVLVAIPVSVLVAFGFTVLVEERSHGWARAAGVWASQRYASAFRASTEVSPTDRREAATPAQRSPAS